MRPSEWGRRFRGRKRSAWVLVALVALLGLGVLVAVLAGRGGREAAPAPPAAGSEPAPATTGAPPAPPPPPATTVAPPPATTAPSPPPPPTGPPEGFAVWDIRVVELTPFSARVAWRTTRPAPSRLAWGLAGGGSTLWGPPPGDAATDHEAALSGLSPSTAYTVSLRANDGDERAEASVDVQTAPIPADVTASTGGGAILLDGQPYFPLMVWAQCPDGYDANLAAGINLFAANHCGDVYEQLDSLGGRAFSAVVHGDREAHGGPIVGWFYKDEPDFEGTTGDTLPALPLEPGEVSFLTLSNHFYSGADPLDWGREIYPGLAARADVVGFDLYPLQEWCDAGRLLAVYDAHRELMALAPGKPTFQWIEASSFRCDVQPTSVTPETVRAESWLAIAAGARGLGFFPASHPSEIAEAIGGLARQIRGLAPALLAPDAEAGVESDSGTVRVGARSYNGALYVVAVNASFEGTRATLNVPGLDGRTLFVLDENRSVEPDGDGFSDDFGPLAVHVYLVPPAD